MPRCCLILLLILAALPAAAVEAPVLLDPEDAAEMLAAADATPYEGAERLLVFDREHVDVEDSGLSHRYAHRLVKVVEPGGALALRALAAQQRGDAALQGLQFTLQQPRLHVR